MTSDIWNSLAAPFTPLKIELQPNLQGEKAKTVQQYIFLK